MQTLLQTLEQEDDGISRIMEMGFGREEVVKALHAAHNDAERALEYLTTGIPDGQGQAASEPGEGGEIQDADNSAMTSEGVGEDEAQLAEALRLSRLCIYLGSAFILYQIARAQATI